MYPISPIFWKVSLKFADHNTVCGIRLYRFLIIAFNSFFRITVFQKWPFVDKHFVFSLKIYSEGMEKTYQTNYNCIENSFCLIFNVKYLFPCILAKSYTSFSSFAESM